MKPYWAFPGDSRHSFKKCISMYSPTLPLIYEIPSLYFNFTIDTARKFHALLTTFSIYEKFLRENSPILHRQLSLITRMLINSGKFMRSPASISVNSHLCNLFQRWSNDCFRYAVQSSLFDTGNLSSNEFGIVRPTSLSVLHVLWYVKHQLREQNKVFLIVDQFLANIQVEFLF